MYGASGNDVIKGSSGSDTLKGQGDVDQVIGNSGSDKLFGGAMTRSTPGTPSAVTTRSTEERTSLATKK